MTKDDVTDDLIVTLKGIDPDQLVPTVCHVLGLCTVILIEQYGAAGAAHIISQGAKDAIAGDAKRKFH